MSDAERDARDPVLILTHSGDYYVPDVVAAAVEKRGHPAIRVDTDRFPVDGALSIGNDSDGNVSALWAVGDIEIDLTRVAAVWCRRVWTGAADVDARFRESAAAQCRDAINGMLAFLEDTLRVRFVNSFAAQSRAEQKVLQLGAARRAGLRMPPSVITNEPAMLRAFVDEQRAGGGHGVVAKMLVPLSQTMDGSGAFVYTSIVDDADVDDADSLRAAPMIFQRQIEKRLEVRAIVVGDAVFSAAVAPGALDWRVGVGGAWRPHALPAEVARASLALVRSLGLVAGALDFLVDADGAHWFLEINPAGEWGWLEKDLGLPIADAIARALVD